MIHEDPRCGRFVLVSSIADQAVPLVINIGQVDVAELRLDGFSELLAVGLLASHDKFG